jgi:hypothetical protein
LESTIQILFKSADDSIVMPPRLIAHSYQRRRSDSGLRQASSLEFIALLVISYLLFDPFAETNN